LCNASERFLLTGAYSHEEKAMKKLRIGFLAVGCAALIPAGLMAANILGPAAPMCAAGGSPSILVRVSGLKTRAGKVRVRTFGGSPANYFDKKKYLSRVELPVPAAGPIDVCMAVPGPGTYAVDVRHDANNNGDTDRADGAGASGNPKMTLFDILFNRKPPAKQVQVPVGRGTAVVPIVVRYL
jgi:uncharacterized protein (DUF2141 family)